MPERYRAYLPVTEIDDPHLAPFVINGVQMVCVGGGATVARAAAEALDMCGVASFIVRDEETGQIVPFDAK